jgi:hypothetical protein
MSRDEEPPISGDKRSIGSIGRLRLWSYFSTGVSATNAMGDGLVGAAAMGVSEQSLGGAVVGFVVGMGLGAVLRSFLTRHSR